MDDVQSTAMAVGILAGAVLVIALIAKAVEKANENKAWDE